MRRYVSAAACLVVALLAFATSARPVPWGACTQALVDAGRCRSTANSYVIFDFPSAARDELIAWAKGQSAYQAEVLCDQERRITDGLLTVAGVTQGDCSADALGELVPNPQADVHVAYAVMRLLLAEEVRKWEQSTADSQALAGASTATRPDLGSDELPP
jgi:hypothetical protein